MIRLCCWYLNMRAFMPKRCPDSGPNSRITGFKVQVDFGRWKHDILMLFRFQGLTHVQPNMVVYTHTYEYTVSRQVYVFRSVDWWWREDNLYNLVYKMPAARDHFLLRFTGPSFTVLYY